MSFIRHGQPVITRLFPHAGNRRYIKAKSGEGSPPTPPGPQPDFHALVPDPSTGLMTGVLTGTGGLTATHAQPIYAKDEKGVYQRFPANTPVWEGARCVLAGGPGTDVVEAYGTDSGNAPLAEAPWLVYQPALTNSCLYSNDQTNVAWDTHDSKPTVTKDQLGLDGAANNACLLTDNNAGSSQNARMNLTSIGASDVVFEVRLKKRAQGAGFPAIGTVINSSWAVLHVNQETGAATEQTGTNAYEVVDDGDWWIFYIHRQAAATAALLHIYPSLASVWGGANDPTATGDIVVGQAAIYLDKTIAEVRGSGPIFTAGAAGSTDQPIYEFDAANSAFDNAVWFTELKPAFAYNEAANVGAGGGEAFVNTLGASNHNFTNSWNSRFLMRAGGTSVDDLTVTFARDQVVKWAGYYADSDGRMNQNGDGVYDPNPVSNYSYVPLTGVIRLFGSNGAVYRMRGFRRYATTGEAESMSIIDTLMGAGNLSDMDNDGLPDSTVARAANTGGFNVTQDADSINVDLNNDGVADVVIPKP